jgi:hypothetical protein
MMWDTDALDISGLRAAINRGDVCEYTTIQLLPTTTTWNVERPWNRTGMHRRNRGVAYRLMLTVGASLMFVSLVGLGVIGGFVWLSSRGH